jgi:hypothetical protein
MSNMFPRKFSPVGHSNMGEVSSIYLRSVIPDIPYREFILVVFLMDPRLRPAGMTDKGSPARQLRRREVRKVGSTTCGNVKMLLAAFTGRVHSG